MPEDLRVCFVGDSFVAGIGDPEHRGWVGRLASGSTQAGRMLTAYNLGVRGQTSEEVAARWAAECAVRLPATVDGRVVLSVGVNDSAEENRQPRVPPERSIQCLDAILDEATARHWPVLVVGPPPVADHAHNDRTAHVDRAFAAISAARGVPYVGVLGPLTRNATWMAEVAAGDGAHPGADGYAALAALVRPAWSAWVG